MAAPGMRTVLPRHAGPHARSVAGPDFLSSVNICSGLCEGLPKTLEVHLLRPRIKALPALSCHSFVDLFALGSL